MNTVATAMAPVVGRDAELRVLQTVVMCRPGRSVDVGAIDHDLSTKRLQHGASRPK